jgi:hypothetical protein
MSKINSINDIQRLMESLGAKKETGDGWASWTIDCGPGRLTHTDLSIKPQASSNKHQARQTDKLWKPGIRVKNRFNRKV